MGKEFKPKVRLPEVDLTSTQRRQWEETLAAVNWVTPGFAHILYSMLNRKQNTQVACFSKVFPFVGGTDGSQLIFNPEMYFALSLMKRVFICVHEIMHCVYDHCGQGHRLRKLGTLTWEGRTLPYAHEPANMFQDFIINDGLIESKIGEWPGFGLHDTGIATHKDSWVEVYFKYVKENKKGGGKGKGKGSGTGTIECDLPGLNPDGTPDPNAKPQKGQQPVTQPGKSGQGDPSDGQGDQIDDGIPQRVQGAFDGHLDPGLIEDEKPNEAPQRSKQEWEQAVAAALTISRAQGKLPAALEHMFKSVLEPKTDWRDHIRGIMARRVGSGGYDYRRPDRRLLVRDIVIPGRSGHGVDTVVLGADSSGSIYYDPDLLDVWLGEAKGLLEDLRPKKIWLVWCDAKIQRIDELTDPSDLDWVRHKGAPGGGGTDFRPVFDWVEEQHLNPDCLLYLTDMFGDFPDVAPRYPVIWGSVSPGVPAPFGDIVNVPYNPQDK